jgi:hypothetical protein
MRWHQLSIQIELSHNQIVFTSSPLIEQTNKRDDLLDVKQIKRFIFIFANFIWQILRICGSLNVIVKYYFF